MKTPYFKIFYNEALMPFSIMINTMKKLTTILIASIFSMLSATTFACPKGTTLTGGTGPNHKGGTCVPIDQAKHVNTKTQNTATKTTLTKSNSESKQVSKPIKEKTAKSEVTKKVQPEVKKS